jgi:hypothetical protein
MREDPDGLPSSSVRLRRRLCSYSDIYRGLVSPHDAWQLGAQSHGRGDPGQPCNARNSQRSGDLRRFRDRRLPVMATQSAVYDSRATRSLVLIAAILVVLGDAGYVLIIATQGSYPADAFTVPFLAGYWLLMAAMLGLSLLDRPRLATLRPALRAGAAAGLLVTGVLGLFSIGLPMVIAGALATGAAVRTLAGRNRRWAVSTEVLAAVIAVVVVVAGLELTARVILCPAHGESDGGGTGLVTGAYTWKCTEGHLTFTNA